MSDDQEYGLLEPFYIDKGELEGLSPQECFVLGIEWQIVADLADNPAGFARPVHEANVLRLSKMLTRRGRRFRFQPTGVGTWLWLTVEPVDQ